MPHSSSAKKVEKKKRKEALDERPQVDLYSMGLTDSFAETKLALCLCWVK